VKFLIDTNIFIPLEPTRPSDVEIGTPAVTELARLMTEARYQMYVHPCAREDIRHDDDAARRELREIQINKYLPLPEPPPPSSRLERILGPREFGTNDWVDHQLLAALEAEAIDVLITEDRSLIRKAVLLGLGDRINTIAEAVSFLRDLFDKVPSPPPSISSIRAHSLNEADPIFHSLRGDYPGFDVWLQRCKRGHRLAWIVESYGADYAGVCVVKQESPNEFDLIGKVLKICTFKISEQHNGLRLGELLLKAIFDHAFSNNYDMIYVTVFDKYRDLLWLLDKFGFEDSDCRTDLGEIVMVKPLSFTEEDRTSLDPLAFNIRYGPSAMKFESVPAFVVPIQPRFHRVLFPEAESQLPLMPDRHPCGNSIRKAYLSNAVIRLIKRGDILLFYRSGDIRGVTAIGVVEDTHVSCLPTDIAHFVWNRTVYRFSDIVHLCQKDVLAILFRQSRILKDPIPLDQLIARGFLSAAPQSIIQLPEEASGWLQSRLDA